MESTIPYKTKQNNLSSRHTLRALMYSNKSSYPVSNSSMVECIL